MGAVYRNTMQSHSTGRICCATMNNINDYLDNIPDHYSEWTRAKGVNREILLGRGDYKLANYVILSHIRDCCGHQDLLEELFGYTEIQHLESTEEHNGFLFCLAVLISRESYQISDKLWRCLPILKNAMHNHVYGINLEGLFDHFVDLDRLFADVRVTPQILLDFIIFLDESFIFKVLVSVYINLDIRASDLEKLIESGEYIPSPIADLYKDTKMYDNMSSDDENKRKILGVTYGQNVERFELWLRFRTRPYSIHPFFLSYENNMEHPYFLDENEVQEGVDLRKDVSIDEIAQLLEVFCRCGIPIYLGYYKLTLHDTTPTKSARK